MTRRPTLRWNIHLDPPDSFIDDKNTSNKTSLSILPIEQKTSLFNELALTRLSQRLDDLPILKPPGNFGTPVFKCKTPSLSWQHCGCPSHSHLPPRRSTITWSALKRCGQDAFYRTWPNRSAKRLLRPQKRTVGTQSSFDGVRSSLGTLRCVSRSIDMTATTMDQEIG
ncbi:Neuropilin and tolloid-like protein 2, partial [Vespula maculifrons]